MGSRGHLVKLCAVAALRGVITIAFCLAVGYYASKLGRVHAETRGCWIIDKSGELCTPAAPEIFVEEAHDFYVPWQQPHRPGVSCCNTTDCAPVEARYDDGRRLYQAYIAGEWRDIPLHIMLDPNKPENATPDGSFHACWNHRTLELLCFRTAEPKI